MQEREVRDSQIVRKEVKPSLLADGIILYIEILSKSQNKILELINEFIKIIG